VIDPGPTPCDRSDDLVLEVGEDEADSPGGLADRERLGISGFHDASRTRPSFVHGVLGATVASKEVRIES
jgi:hypothetical protein